MILARVKPEACEGVKGLTRGKHHPGIAFAEPPACWECWPTPALSPATNAFRASSAPEIPVQLAWPKAPAQARLQGHPISPRRRGSQPHFPLDFFLGGLLFPVAGLTAGTLGFIFLAITPPFHAV
jgi:hypothetical protein